eukprot:SAG11_NODE_581_length_8363_cov_13.931873_9_plen_68_part_00
MQRLAQHVVVSARRLNEDFAQNAARNEPFEDDVHHPGYTPLQTLPDGELAAIGKAQLKSLGAERPRL